MQQKQDYQLTIVEGCSEIDEECRSPMVLRQKHSIAWSWSWVPVGIQIIHSALIEMIHLPAVCLKGTRLPHRGIHQGCVPKGVLGGP